MSGVVVRQEMGGYYAHSPAMPGLSVWGCSLAQVGERVTEAVALLRKLNGGSGAGLNYVTRSAANP